MKRMEPETYHPGCSILRDSKESLLFQRESGIETEEAVPLDEQE